MMRNKYCIKCGSDIRPRAKQCKHCNALVIDVALSSEENATGKIEELQVKKPMNRAKGTGCLIILVAFLLIVGVPAVFALTGIGFDNLITKIIMSVIFLGINIGLFMYRKTMGYEENRVYVLTEKDTTFFDHLENKCRYCEHALTDEMIYCPNCSLHTAEDIPILRSLKSDECASNRGGS